MYKLKAIWYRLLGYKIVNYPLGKDNDLRTESDTQKLYSKVDGWRHIPIFLTKDQAKLITTKGLEEDL